MWLPRRGPGVPLARGLPVHVAGWGPKNPGMAPKEAPRLPVAGESLIPVLVGGSRKPLGWLRQRPGWHRKKPCVPSWRGARSPGLAGWGQPETPRMAPERPWSTLGTGLQSTQLGGVPRTLGWLPKRPIRVPSLKCSFITTCDPPGVPGHPRDLVCPRSLLQRLPTSYPHPPSTMLRWWL